MASTIDHDTVPIRFRNQLDMCVRRQFSKPLTGIEKQAIEEQENRSMHEEIDSFIVGAG
jgi:hypothetical protein